jgi:hypothetical protein
MKVAIAVSAPVAAHVPWAVPTKTRPGGVPGGGGYAGSPEVRAVPSAPKVLKVRNVRPSAVETTTRQEPTMADPS